MHAASQRRFRPITMTEEQEVFLKHIQQQGLKRTAQRDLILEVFLQTEGHLSGEDLYRLVQEKDPTVCQTTVYRTLRLLTESGHAREFVDIMRHDDHPTRHGLPGNQHIKWVNRYSSCREESSN